MADTETFTYWKRPGHRWLVLAMALLQLLALWEDVREFRAISQAGIFTASAWTSYAAGAYMGFAFKGMLAALCLVGLAIEALARSRRAARRAKGWLLLAFALPLGAMGLVFLRADLQGGYWALWIVSLLIALAGGIHALRESRNRP